MKMYYLIIFVLLLFSCEQKKEKDWLIEQILNSDEFVLALNSPDNIELIINTKNNTIKYYNTRDSLKKKLFYIENVRPDKLKLTKELFNENKYNKKNVEFGVIPYTIKLSNKTHKIIDTVISQGTDYLEYLFSPSENNEFLKEDNTQNIKTTYYPWGQKYIEEIRIICNDSIFSTERYWDRLGVLLLEVNLLNDKKNGYKKIFYSTGQIQKIECYKNGIIEEVKKYYLTGQLSEMDEYCKGDLIKSTSFDNNGIKIKIDDFK